MAVLVDATIVRAVLLPAATTLLGDWSWYRRAGSSGRRLDVNVRRPVADRGSG